MKVINKTLDLAIVYKNWLEQLHHENRDHPEYTSSSGRFYYDIVANLLWVQKGLCAYTEMHLVDQNRVNPKLWNEGRFHDFDFLGQLDHYDSTLKETKGWDWDNFFVIHSDVNTKHKRTKPVNYLLKPDKEGYDPFYLLDYDLNTHFFIPNILREPEIINKVREDIFSLGLNFEPISDYRRIYLTPIIERIKFGNITPDDAKQGLNKFYTAFEMAVTKL